MSLRAKLTLLLFSGIVAASAAVSASQLWLQWGELEKQAEAKADVILSSAGDMAQESILADDPLMLNEHLAEALRVHPELVSAVTERDGLRLEIQPRSPKPPVAAEDRWVRRIERTATRPGRTSGTAVLELGFSRSALEAGAREVFMRSLRSAGLIVGIAALLGLPLSFQLAGLFISPIRELDSAIDRVAEGWSHEPLIAAKRRDELGRLAERFNRMTERLKELDEMKNTFVRSVTHDIKSPLSAIESYARRIAKEGGADDASKEHLRHIEENAKRLREYVTQLLEQARIERGQFEVRPEPMDLARIVSDTVVFFRPRAEEAGLTIREELASPQLELLADPERVQQVLTNLVGNAIKFTPQGGEITVYAKAVEDGRIEGGVRDTGVGISKEDQGRLFQRFERIKNPLKTGGTGLGLSIVKAIVELHGGTVGVESEPGRGSRFFFSLPSNGRVE